jgi:HEAT repeat protein
VNHRVDYAQEIAAMTTPPDNTPGLGGQHTNDVKLGGDSALLHLINSLDHSDPMVRSRAALMLAGRGDTRAYETLVRVFEEEPQFRQAAIRAFGKLKDARAADRLISLLVDTAKQRRLRIAAAQALGDLNTPQAVEALLNFIEHHHDDQSKSVPVAVVRVLAELREPRMIPILRPLLLAYAPWPFIPFDTLVRWHRGTLFVTLFDTLQALEGPALMADLVTQAHEGDNWAVRVICEMGGPDSIPVLLMLLRQHISDFRQRYSTQTITRALSQYRDQAILDGVLEILATCYIADEWLMRDILQLVSSYEDERTIDAIRNTLPSNIWAVTTTLFKIGDDIAVETIRVLLMHENTLIRNQTQSALRYIHTSEAMTLIAESLGAQGPSMRDDSD